MARWLASKLNIPYEMASEWMGTIWRPLPKGRITENEVWQIFEEKYDRAIDPEQRDIWFKWEELQPLPEMIALVRELRIKGYPVAVVSNATPGTSDEIQSNGGYDGV